MSYVMGIHLDHDLGACLLRDGQIAVYIEEERLTRVKHGVTAATREGADNAEFKALQLLFAPPHRAGTDTHTAHSADGPLA